MDKQNHYSARPIMLSRTKQHKKLQEIVDDRDKKRGETFFFHHVALNEGSWGNNEEMREQMKIWRRQKKEGILEINTGNNREFMINGKMWFTLVVQDVDVDKNRIDRLGFGVGFVVQGMIYWFSSETNRNSVVNYVMKINKHHVEEVKQIDVVFSCCGCGINIIRDSKEHDFCHVDPDDEDRWFCGDCC